MKRAVISVISVILFSGIVIPQENFKVIRVNGNITIKANGTSLRTGTVFTEKDDLLFSTEDATAAVINPSKGRLILTSRNHDLTATGSNYLPSMYSMATRGGMITDLNDLKKHFADKYVVIDRHGIMINTDNFPMDDNHFFFLRYVYKGEEINKKLDYSGDQLIIDREKLYAVDGNPIPRPDNTWISLFYRNGSESMQVNHFELIFPDTKSLKEEVSIILSELKNKTDREKIDEVASFINDFYGKVNTENLKTWIGMNFNIK